MFPQIFNYSQKFISGFRKKFLTLFENSTHPGPGPWIQNFKLWFQRFRHLKLSTTTCFSVERPKATKFRFFPENDCRPLLLSLPRKLKLEISVSFSAFWPLFFTNSQFPWFCCFTSNTSEEAPSMSERARGQLRCDQHARALEMRRVRAPRHRVLFLGCVDSLFKT